MSRYKQAFGEASEKKAAEYLRQQGYRILSLNYRTKLGEIDIIARDGAVICFVEVKSRSSFAFGHPKDAVDSRKQRKISQCALLYLKENNIYEKSCRFDILSIIQECPDRFDFQLLKAAFDLYPAYA